LFGSRQAKSRTTTVKMMEGVILLLIRIGGGSEPARRAGVGLPPATPEPQPDHADAIGR